MKKIWNRPDHAVWSLVTRGKDGVFNMNICSYVTAVSMKPKVMLVAVYGGTKTGDNIAIGEMVRLQLLSESQATLVRLLGQQSGRKIPKLARLKKRDCLAYQADWPYLTAAVGYLDLTITQLLTVDLDHDLALCAVMSHRNLSQAPILTTTYLKDKKFTR